MSEPAEGELALARAALAEITAGATIGAFAGMVDEGDGVSSVLFAATMPGYRGWNWTVSVAHLPGQEASVLETELMPGDGALLSPDWVPWADRLTEYRAAQQAAGLAEDGSALEADEAEALADDDLDDDDELDDLDDDLDDLDDDDLDVDADDLDDDDVDDLDDEDDVDDVDDDLGEDDVDLDHAGGDERLS